MARRRRVILAIGVYRVEPSLVTEAREALLWLGCSPLRFAAKGGKGRSSLLPVASEDGSCCSPSLKLALLISDLSSGDAARELNCCPLKFVALSFYPDKFAYLPAWLASFLGEPVREE